MNLTVKRDTIIKIFLCTISGVLLGFSFPPFHTGIFAAFAFIPFFIVLSDIEEYGQAFRYSYYLFFIMNLIAISWVGGFIHGKDIYLMIAGVSLLLVHPIFLSIPIFVFIFIRRNLSFKSALFSFPFIWVSFEYLHSITELAFPWLTLGNTQTYDLALIQYAGFTGVYGISFWIILMNVLILVLFAKLSLKEWKPFSKYSVSLLLLIVMIFTIPKIYGINVLSEKNKSLNKKLKIAVIQPNIDPWEKWEYETQASQLETYQEMTSDVGEKVDLIIWAETATPYYILLPQYQYYFNMIKDQVDFLNTPLLTGIPDIYFYKEGEKIPPSAKKMRSSGEYYDSYNSSMLLIPKKSAIQKYAKIRLVPFSERVPYADYLNFLNFLEWGVGIGGWGIGKDTTVFNLGLSDSLTVKFSNLICYESIYPSFVASFVKKGAEFLTIITNDSWWGDTYGAYQHKQYAVLRAVENRRWIARCANGGISCFIDPFGNVYEETKMYSTATIIKEIDAINELTFYSENGDIFSHICLFASGFIIVAAFSQNFYKFIRRKRDELY